MPAGDAGAGERLISGLWQFVGVTSAISAVLGAATEETECPNQLPFWIVSVPASLGLWLAIRVSCPTAGCSNLCPNMGSDLIDKTMFLRKAVKGAGYYSFFCVVMVGISMYVNVSSRKACGDRVPSEGGCAGHEADGRIVPAIPGDICDTTCKCKVTSILVLGIMAQVPTCCAGP